MDPAFQKTERKDETIKQRAMKKTECVNTHVDRHLAGLFNNI